MFVNAGGEEQLLTQERDGCLDELGPFFANDRAVTAVGDDPQT